MPKPPPPPPPRKRRSGPVRSAGAGTGRRPSPPRPPPPPKHARRSARPKTKTLRSGPPPPPPPRRRRQKPDAQIPISDQIVCGVSEFGLLLAELIGRDENFLGAIVTDDEGNPVDYARRPDGISALDLQIVGAQVECCMTPLDKACARLSDGPCTVVAVEASHGTLLATTVAEIFVMVATAKASPDLPRLLREFSGVARELTVLLES